MINKHNHECTVGLWYGTDDSELLTLKELEDHIEDKIEIDKMLVIDCGMQRKVFNLVDYFDKRKSTNFSWFNYCPYCGKEIDTKELKSQILQKR